MQSPLLEIALLVASGVTIGSARDSSFRPKSQQIPVPECLTMEGFLEGRLETV
jgi:hypothetical protein